MGHFFLFNGISSAQFGNATKIQTFEEQFSRSLYFYENELLSILERVGIVILYYIRSSSSNNKSSDVSGRFSNSSFGRHK